MMPKCLYFLRPYYGGREGVKANKSNVSFFEGFPKGAWEGENLYPHQLLTDIQFWLTKTIFLSLPDVPDPVVISKTGAYVTVRAADPEYYFKKFLKEKEKGLTARPLKLICNLNVADAPLKATRWLKNGSPIQVSSYQSE